MTKSKSKTQMTCQCCGRAIHAKLGTIAHHGYQRPGDGWQTASCMGAKYAPFEVSRDRLGDMIALIRRDLDGAKKRLQEAQDESAPLAVSFEDSRTEQVWDPRRYRKAHQTTTVQVTRATFEAAKAEHAEHATYRSFPYSYDDLKKREVNSRAYKVKNLTDFLAQEQARYDAWKQTHTRNDEKDGWDPI